MQLINLPSRAESIAALPEQRQGRSLSASADNNRVRFVFDAPLATEQNDNNRNYLKSTSIDSAATSAENFQLLLKEQETTATVNNNASNLSPFENAISAYTSGANTAQYARPRGVYLASL